MVLTPAPPTPPGKLLEPHTYAALQTLDDPNEICTYMPVASPRVPQAEHVREVVGTPGLREPFGHSGGWPLGSDRVSEAGVGGGADPHDPAWSSAQAQTCTQLLTRVAPECNVSKEPFVQSCQEDMAECAQPGQQDCSCATLSEYSRRCSMAGQAVSSWRGPGLCRESSREGQQGGPGPQAPMPQSHPLVCEMEGDWVHEGGLGPGPGRRRGLWDTPAPVTEAVCAAAVGPCPANQVYQECGEACIKTCSNPQHTCSSFCTFGCFCPKGEGNRSPWEPRNSTLPDSNTLEQGLTCPREGKGSPPPPLQAGLWDGVPWGPRDC